MFMEQNAFRYVVNREYAEPIEFTEDSISFYAIDKSQFTTLDKDVKTKHANKEAAKELGTLIAKRAADKKIETVVFDRGGYIYHGVVKELAEAAREGGLDF